jgi:1-acyl-sn-glycerol-3-phosphate acyltransferase
MQLARRSLQAGIIRVTNAIAEVDVGGRQHLAALEPPVLFVANHSSHLDTPMLLSVLPPSCRNRLAVAAARDYFFARPLLGRAVSVAFNAFPVDRGWGLRATLADCQSLRQQGYSILLFPEGTRSRTGEIGRFKRGVGLLAVQLGLPVVPIRLTGVFELLPTGRTLPRRGKVSIRVGAPLHLDPHTSSGEAAALIRKAVHSVEEG